MQMNQILFGQRIAVIHRMACAAWTPLLLRADALSAANYLAIAHFSAYED